MSRKAFRYAVVRHRGHTRANSQGQVLAHLVIAEHALGKPLPPSAEVHHVDGNPTNNAHSNLVICEDRLYHKLLHYRQKVRAHGGDPNIHRLCSRCRKPKPFSEFVRSKANLAFGLGDKCRPCRQEFNRTYALPLRLQRHRSGHGRVASARLSARRLQRDRSVPRAVLAHHYPRRRTGAI
jgi:hypothetical protein